MRGLQRLISAAVLGLSVAAPVAAQQTLSGTFTAPQLRIEALRALELGERQATLAMTQALLSADPSDLDALLMASRASRELGRMDDALGFGRRAWKAADTQVEKYAASMVMARAYSASGRQTAAQLWLRRARQLGPDDQAKALAAKEFQRAKFFNPWTTNLSFNVAPTSNLNNGTTRDSIYFDALGLTMVPSTTAVALSGTEISGGFETLYRFNETEVTRWTLSAAASHSTYILSEESKRQAPGSKGSDFSSSRVSFGLSQDKRFPSAFTELSWSAQVAQSWYGGDPLTRSFILGLSGNHALPDQKRVGFGISHEWQRGLNGRADANILGGKLWWSTPVADRDLLRLTLGGTLSQSTASFQDYNELRLSALYALGKPVLKSNLSFSATMRKRHYDVTPYASGGRDDQGVSVSATAVLRDVEYFGFRPSVTVTASKTESNLDLYDSHEYGMFMGIRSAF
jgi:tetratricopeptide (TPR) repeat protein